MHFVRHMPRGTLTGLAGTVLLAVSAWLASPWGLGFAGRENTLAVRWAHAAPAGVGVFLLFLGWISVRHLDLPQAWRTFWWWCLPLLACPPLLSKDAWAYLEQGWIVLQGFNPYETGLSTIGGPFAGRVDSYWQGTTTVYPPLALLIQAGAVVLGGAGPFWSLLAMRLPGLLGVLIIGACLPRIARATGQDAAGAIWLGLLNPLVLVHFIGGAHNDAWATALGVAGLWLAIRWRPGWPLGCILVGLAMAIKQPLGLMMVAVALVGLDVDPAASPREAWRTTIGAGLWRLPLGLLFTVAGFAIPTLASGWGVGWARSSGAPQSAGSQSIAHTTAAALQLVTGWPMSDAVAAVAPVFLGIGVGIIGLLGWRHGASRPVTFSAWALVAFAVTYPSLQPWYALWGGVLLGTVGLSRRGLAWVVTISGCLLVTSVLLEYAGWPIPVVQVAALAMAWPLNRWLARIDLQPKPVDRRDARV